MRTIITVIFVVLFLILSMPVLLVCKLIRRRNPAKADRIAQATVGWAFRVVAFLSGVHTEVIGAENIPDDHAVLFVGNHRSIFDIVLTYPLLKAPCGYIAKDSLAKVPLLNFWMKEIGCLFLNRTDLKQGMQTILNAIDMVKNGTSVFIFPEGTRSKGESELPMLPFHEGSLRVSSKSGVPTIPITLLHTQNILESHLPWLRRTDVTIIFGTPVIPSELSRDEKKHMGEYTAAIIDSTLRSHLGIPQIESASSAD
ncbi:MAG: lysophospholipid acyltransferase family protein [Eubacteriales bacterium]|nr:lysophospholipid acyltransferase family protein [Eubacteriales bacterium]